MNISELLKSPNYRNKELTHLYSSNIYEYDVKAANINCLLAEGAISQNLYDYLNTSTKQFREVYIGNMIKADRNIYKIIQKVLTECKAKLIKEFTTPDNVIRIANDAVFFTNPLTTLPDKYVVLYNNTPITFIRKNIYTSFLSFDKLLVFMNTFGEDFLVDVVGINNDLLPLHEKFLSIICETVQVKELGDTKTALIIYNDYYTKFINRKLPIEYYREFNSISKFRLDGSFGSFYLDYIDPTRNDIINNISIDTNLFILRTLYSYLLI